MMGEMVVDSTDILGGINFFGCLANGFPRVIRNVAPRDFRLDRNGLWKNIAGNVKNDIQHAHKQFIEGLLIRIGYVTPVGVTPMVELEQLVGLDLVNYRSPLCLPIVGDEQSMLHEIFYRDENSMTLEMLENVLLIFVVAAIVLIKRTHVELLLLPA